jgi:hypothetical protein
MSKRLHRSGYSEGNVPVVGSDSFFFFETEVKDLPQSIN